MTAAKTWKCEVCGYIHTGESPPKNCPVCGVDGDQFSEMIISPVETKQSGEKWQCGVCGYLHEGDAPPEACPVCSAPKTVFTPMTPPDTAQKNASNETIVIIGAGIAGMTAAETVAAAAAKTVLVSKEPGLPYYRLNLTRYLAGEVTAADLVMQNDDWFKEHHIDRVEGDVVNIDPGAREIRLRDSRTIAYDKLIIAAGAHPFIPPIPGINRQGVMPLRTKADADALIASAHRDATCVVIGGGLLGLEAAGALLKRGRSVTVLEGYGWLLPRQLPRTAGDLLGKILAEKGLRLMLEVTTKEILGDDHVRGVLLEDGTEIPADLVVVSTGVRSNTYLARQCGLNVGGGILVDDALRTSDPNIYAAGDVCEHRGTLYGIWPASYLQGAVAAANAVGQARRFTGIPRSNRLKVFDIDLFSIGMVNPEDASAQVFEKQEGDAYHRLVTRDGALKGAIFIGDTTLAGRIQEAIEAGTQLSEWPDLKKRFSCLNTDS